MQAAPAGWEKGRACRDLCTRPSCALCSALCPLQLVVCALHPGLCAALRGLYAIQCERRCANQTELLHKGASSCCTLTPSASVLHVWQSCNLATVQCTMVARRSPRVEIIFKLESSSFLCEPVALYAENIIPKTMKYSDFVYRWLQIC